MPQSESASSDNRVNEAIVAYLQAIERGDKPDRARFLAEHADIAAEVESFLVNQSQVQQFARNVDPGSVSARRTPGNPEEQPASDPNEPTMIHPQRGVPSAQNVLRYFGDYELIQEIARGGMGVVYKARQVTLNRIVAVKMILGGQLAGPEDVQRFHTEPEAAAQLDHPGIVPVYEVGEKDGQQLWLDNREVDLQTLRFTLDITSAKFVFSFEEAGLRNWLTRIIVSNMPELCRHLTGNDSPRHLRSAIQSPVHFICDELRGAGDKDDAIKAGEIWSTPGPF